MTVRLRGIAWMQGKWIRYYMIKELREKNEVYDICLRYGAEEIVIPDLALSGKEVRCLLRTMLRCRVTPTAVPDVIEDWLGR